MSVKSLLEELKSTNALLNTMAEELGRIAQALAPSSPNYRRPLAEFAVFDWTSINATVAQQDDNGVAEIQWNGHRYKRRSGDGKFGNAIWFSRPIGQSDEGTEYARLITFKNLDPAESLAPGLAQSTNLSSESPNPQIPATPSSAHLIYQDGIAVPNDERTVAIFNSFLGANQRKPDNAAELRAWFTEPANAHPVQ